MSRPTGEGGTELCLPIKNEEPRDSGSHHRVDKDVGLGTCRVCQCVEPDRRGSAALEFLGISPPQRELNDVNEDVKSNFKVGLKATENNRSCINDLKGSELVEFISPSGEVFLCTADVEMGVDDFHDRLVDLGCSCKSDLALAHYACALKWFINHGSTVCEICGSLAKNVKSADFKRILVSLKKYEALMERVANGQPNPAPSQTHLGVDPDAVAAIRRQRLSEISLWFNPHNSYSVTTSQVVSEQPAASNVVVEEDAPTENTAAKWAVEGTGILLATGLLTVTLAWLIAPHVGKKTAKNGLHILLGGICALTVVVFFRFFWGYPLAEQWKQKEYSNQKLKKRRQRHTLTPKHATLFVLTRIKYGPARYWAILFVFWFLVFGIWASRTHGAHAK